MTTNDPDQHLSRQTVIDVLSLVAVALFVTYAVTLLNAVLPLPVGQTDGLSRLIGALLDGAPLPLVGMVGLGLVHLLAHLEPDRLRLRARRRAVARWASGAALGSLLMVPLQAVSAAQGYGLVVRSRSSAMAVATERADAFQHAIDAAASVEDLQQRIAALQRPGLRLEAAPSSDAGTEAEPERTAPGVPAKLQNRHPFPMEAGALGHRPADPAGPRSGPGVRPRLRGRQPAAGSRGLPPAGTSGPVAGPVGQGPAAEPGARATAPRTLPADMASLHALNEAREPQDSGSGPAALDGISPQPRGQGAQVRRRWPARSPPPAAC